MRSLSFIALAAIAVPAAARSDAEMRAIIAKQQAQIDALTARLNALESKAAPAPQQAAAPPAQASRPEPAAPAIAFKGSPEIATDDGWRFKIRGRVNHDTTFVEEPGALRAKDLGLHTRFRRARIGVEGDMPGGFGYKAEFDFADNQVRAADVLLSYRASRTAPFEVALGHFEPLNGLEQISSSRYTSTLERGAFNEAFGNFRRLGVALTYIAPGDDFRVSAGAFGDTISADRASDELLLSSRAAYFPKIGATQLHFGALLQYRTYQTNQLDNAYRARPFVNGPDLRFVDTGTLALRSDTVLGGEFIAIRGPFHVHIEAQRLSADTIAPGEALGAGDVALGRRLSRDPRFFGLMAEAGWFFTGETRGFRDGLWTRTRPLRPLDKGGIGAISLNLRYDHLDLTDRRGGEHVNGGLQDGYIAALVWQPTDYVRFTLQYTHGIVTGGPFQSLVKPISMTPLDEQSFSFDVAGLRAAWDF